MFSDDRISKGMDKPIFLVASFALVLMFVALYFATVSGWIDGVVQQFTEAVSGIKTGTG